MNRVFCVLLLLSLFTLCVTTQCDNMESVFKAIYQCNSNNNIYDRNKLICFSRYCSTACDIDDTDIKQTTSCINECVRVMKLATQYYLLK